MPFAWRQVKLLLIAAGLVATLGAGAQQTGKAAHIGVLCINRCDVGPQIDALRDGLRSAGWIEGGNLLIEYRGAAGHIERLPALAQELVGLKPDLIVAYNPQPSRAAKNATSTIPIVFIAVGDPVRVGLVESLGRPGGNATGLATLVPGGYLGKQLETLLQAVPRATRVAVLVNPNNEVATALLSSEGPPAARRLGVSLQRLEARTPEEIEPLIEAAVRQKADALWVISDPVILNPPQRVPDLALRAKLPTMNLAGVDVAAGGLMSYGPDFLELSRRAATYVDKILHGAKPTDMPVEQPTRFLLAINLKTARTLGISIPQPLLLRADEVIQ